MEGEFKNSFTGLTGGGSIDEKQTYSVKALALKYESEKNSNQKMTNDFSITLGGRLALIIGIEGNLTLGVREKQNKK